MNGGDLSSHLLSLLALRTDVLNIVEWGNSMSAKQATVTRAFTVLCKFLEEEIQKPVRREGPATEILQALFEYQQMLKLLIRAGHLEFKPHLQLIEQGMAKLFQTTRQQLVQRFLDPATTPEDHDLIRDSLVEIIEAGAWPNWQLEFNAAVDARSPPLAPEAA